MNIIDDISIGVGSYNPTGIFSVTWDPNHLIKPHLTHTFARIFSTYNLDPYLERYTGVRVLLEGNIDELRGFSVRLEENTWI